LNCVRLARDWKKFVASLGAVGRLGALVSYSLPRVSHFWVYTYVFVFSWWGWSCTVHVSERFCPPMRRILARVVKIFLHSTEPKKILTLEDGWKKRNWARTMTSDQVKK
jgi:hypothetical protein